MNIQGDVIEGERQSQRRNNQSCPAVLARDITCTGYLESCALRLLTGGRNYGSHCMGLIGIDLKKAWEEIIKK